MADISAELAAIKSAVYGEEVRNSIHGGLEKMNAQLNTAIGSQVIDKATVDSIVSSGIDALIKNINATIKEIVSEFNVSVTFSQGSINGTYGTTTNSDTRCRTTYIGAKGNFGFYVNFPSSKKWCMYEYATSSGAEFLGAIVPAWKTGDCYVAVKKGHYIKIVVANADDSNITPSSLSDYTIVGVESTAIKFNRLLTSSDDIDSVVTAGIYEWKSSSVPTNSPTVLDATLFVSTTNESTSQVIITSDGSVMIRFCKSSTWTSWNKLLANTSNRLTALENKPVLTYIRELTASDDIDLLHDTGLYKWAPGQAPFNSPTTHPGKCVILDSQDVRDVQIVMSLPSSSDLDHTIWVRRGLSASSWGSWTRLGTKEDFLQIVDRISGIESSASITGNTGTNYTISGITMTKVADNEFTLSGNSTKTAIRGFNVLLGSSELVSSNDTVPEANITSPGIYTVGYRIDEVYEGSNTVFAITTGRMKERRYIKNGESFVVDTEPVSLMAYAPSSLKLGNRTITVKWSLYKGEEFVGYPYLENDQYIAIDPIARNIANNKGQNKQYNEYLSWGKANLMARAEQIMNVKWKPTAATMPKGDDAFYDINTTYKGLPYSSVRDSMTSVGTNVSIHTFMTAVHDPRSVLYTRRSNSSNASTYYGTVCSGLCNYAYGYELNLTNYYLGESDWFTTVPMQDIQTGDMIYKPGHVAMIYEVIKDDYGRIKEVTVMEEWFPNTRFVTYSSYDSFLSGRTNYIARRYKNISGVPYTPIPYVRCFDEDVTDIIYPDVQPENGDASVFMAGETVTINVIDRKDYTRIVVSKSGATIKTLSTFGNSFTVENVSAGLYTITASGTSGTSVSNFFVVNGSGSYDPITGIVTFSSSNADPVLVNVYDLPIKDGKYAITNHPIVLTDEDIARGWVNASEFGMPYARVTFKTPYGTADWRSETHATWTPV